MLIPLIIALLGCIIAGTWDLFTTDIPDEVSESMIVLGIFYWAIKSLQVESLKPLLISLTIGILFLLFGYILYKTGQWGGGDAKILASLGFLLPFFGNMQYFPLNLIINVFAVGSVYVIIYSLLLGISKNIFPKFFEDIPKISFVLSIILIISGFFIPNRELSILVVLFGFLILFWYYAKTIEKYIFTRRVHVSKVKVGDVLFSSKEWEGITKEELDKLKKGKKKYVKIKEGIRFGPVFFFALLFTILYGNLLFLIL